MRATTASGYSFLPTPTATDHCGRGYHRSGGKVYLSLPGALEQLAGRHYQNPNTSKIDPSCIESLMGFPIGWTDLGHSETP